jgi:hypothetical protein
MKAFTVEFGEVRKGIEYSEYQNRNDVTVRSVIMGRKGSGRSRRREAKFDWSSFEDKPLAPETTGKIFTEAYAFSKKIMDGQQTIHLLRKPDPEKDDSNAALVLMDCSGERHSGFTGGRSNTVTGLGLVEFPKGDASYSVEVGWSEGIAKDGLASAYQTVLAVVRQGHPVALRDEDGDIFEIAWDGTVLSSTKCENDHPLFSHTKKKKASRSEVSG